MHRHTYKAPLTTVVVLSLGVLVAWLTFGSSAGSQVQQQMAPSPGNPAPSVTVDQQAAQPLFEAEGLPAPSMSPLTGPNGVVRAANGDPVLFSDRALATIPIRNGIGALVNAVPPGASSTDLQSQLDKWIAVEVAAGDAKIVKATDPEFQLFCTRSSVDAGTCK